jgi:hypothetical protein
VQGLAKKKNQQNSVVLAYCFSTTTIYSAAAILASMQKSFYLSKGLSGELIKEDCILRIGWIIGDGHVFMCCCNQLKLLEEP